MQTTKSCAPLFCMLAFLLAAEYSQIQAVDNILVAFGGESEKTNHENIRLKSVEAFSINGNYSRIFGLANMTHAIESFTSTVYNNTIYVAGGFGKNKASNVFYSYNITTNTWSQNLPQLPPNVVDSTARLVAQRDRLLVITSAAGIYALDMQNATKWKKLSTTIPKELSEYGFAHAVVACNNSIFLFGQIGFVYRSDDGTKSWQQKSNMLDEVEDFGLTTLYNGTKIIIAGGHNRQYYNTVQIYDVESDEWIRASPMSQTRDSLAITGVPETDNVVMCGGFAGDTGERLKSCEVFDFKENQWLSMAAELQQGRLAFGLHVVQKS